MNKPAPNTKLLTAIRLKCLTQKELAEQTGISEAYISRFITGNMIPTAEQRRAIASALNTPEGRVF